MGSEMEYRIQSTVISVLAIAFAYFECMLIGAVICGIRAVRHVPTADRDFIIILGCRFRKDGTLTPLLKGRCDAALAFREKQLKETGKEARLIPSGGQGQGESMPEAEAMSRYLLSCGIPSSAILMEDQSRNTYQNMEYSRKIIEREKPDARVLFSTTNYHVFRSGVWAGLAGLKAEGIGSHTKWWFWPNAFLRECVGLMQNRLKQELILLILLVLFNGTLTMVVTI